jgi:acetyl-CoA carboxylase biotin carboxyl carrier protein
VAKEIEFRDVLELIELIKASSNFSEIRLRSGDLEIELRRVGAGAGGMREVSATVVPVESSSQLAPAVPQEPSPLTTPTRRPAPRDGAAASRVRPGVHVVCAPMVGTVYHAPQPGAAPFVSIGQRVAASDTVCIVEVMKLMNAIQAGQAGVVSEILVSDGQPVEAAQELFVLTLA